MSRYILHMWVNVILWHGISHYIKDDNVMISEDNQNAVSGTGNFTASAIWAFRSVTFMMKSDIILFKNDSNQISIYFNEMLGSRGLKITASKFATFCIKTLILEPEPDIVVTAV